VKDNSIFNTYIKKLILILLVQLCGLNALCFAQTWGYGSVGGPTRWQSLSKNFERCGFGRDQSPIDLTAPLKGEGDALKFDYSVSKIKMIENKPWLQLDYTPGSYFENGRSRYELQTLVMRTPSEHTVDGKNFPMEMQLVHKNTKDSKSAQYAIVSVLFKEGDENPWLGAILGLIAEKKTMPVMSEGLYIQPQEWLPKNLSYFYYPGSFTYPPCDEGVSWHVLQNTLMASKTQIAKLTKSFGKNARPPQQRNSRLVRAQEFLK
jgi:carbonic anhydrase